MACSSISREDKPAGREGKVAEQEAGWSHGIYAQKVTPEQEVGPGYKASRFVLRNLFLQ